MVRNNGLAKTVLIAVEHSWISNIYTRDCIFAFSFILLLHSTDPVLLCESFPLTFLTVFSHEFPDPFSRLIFYYVMLKPTYKVEITLHRQIFQNIANTNNKKHASPPIRSTRPLSTSKKTSFRNIPPHSRSVSPARQIARCGTLGSEPHFVLQEYPRPGRG